MADYIRRVTNYVTRGVVLSKARFDNVETVPVKMHRMTPALTLAEVKENYLICFAVLQIHRIRARARLKE